MSMKLEDIQKNASAMVKIDLTGFDDLQHWCSTKWDPKQDIFCATLGLCGEAGEYADLKKKELFHQKPVELETKSKELGDVLFYLCMASRHEGIPMSRIVMDLMAKLNARYPHGFDPARAHAHQPKD